MKTDGLHNEADDESRRDDDAGDDAPFISDERVDEGWTVMPIGHKPGKPVPADFDPYASFFACSSIQSSCRSKSLL